MRRTWTLLSSSVVLALAAGCSSDMGGDSGGKAAASGGTTGTGGSVSNGGSSGTGAKSGGNTSGSSGNGKGGSGATSGTSGGSGTTGNATCTTAQIPPTALRRLTRFEYEQTVQDLLKVESVARERHPRGRGHERLRQQLRRTDRVVAARREVRARLGDAREFGRSEPVGSHHVRHRDAR